ncbi:MAG: aminotransferase class I/II-fold pyridoxal phosphate-dependent enzyme [Acidimicrobiia bacterium]|nr:aminotransferase class I/II-fold pyridoxal phosphate-dependent enzyme [Acidimicrobiia bacterium]
MVDPRIRLSEPTIGDEEANAAARAVRDGHLVFGPDLPAFEAALAAAVGAPGAVAVSTGTAALHLALVTAGVGPGDEVWVSDLTFISSANAITYTGARCVLVDSETESWNLDPTIVADEIRRRARAGLPMPKAIVPVHLLGHPANLEPILDLLVEHGITIVEDAAEALGSRWRGGQLDGRAPGSVGAFGIYSFNFNKPISTGGGGMLVARDPDDLARARHLGAQAKIPNLDYRHDAVGYNYRLSNVAAALGVIQMQRLDGLIARRQAIAIRYRDAFEPLGLGSGPDASWAARSGWLSSAVFADPGTRTAVRSALDARGIESRPIWAPMRLQMPYASCEILGGGVATTIADQVLCLPCSAHLTETQQDEVIETVQHVVRSA